MISLARVCFIPLFLFCLSLSPALYSQIEICDNAIDDDGDGLIDLNDEDCDCLPLETESLIPNPSFEELECCPEDFSSVNCVTNWTPASSTTPDFFHSCEWTLAGALGVPEPLPDGEGVIGFMNGLFGSNNDSNPAWKEYVGACLIDPLIADSFYRFQFFLGFFDRESSPAFDVALFGTSDCANLPFGDGDGSFGCPTNGPGWIRLGIVSVFGENEWKPFQFTFKSPFDIMGIVVGPACSHVQANTTPYYLLDHLVLAKDDDFELEIRPNGQPCAVNFSLEFPRREGYTYQWYKDGIAIPDAKSSVLSKPPGEGLYQLRIENEEGCKISKPFDHIVPYQYTHVNVDICEEEFYLFDNQQLRTPGVYVDTLKRVDNCDSIVQLKLGLMESFERHISAKIFPGESYQVGNFQFFDPGEYKQSIPSSSGCDSTIYLSLDHYSVYIPNAFSPNGDGINDHFAISGGPDLQAIPSLTIFDRWGKIVYQGFSLRPGEGWDGQAAPLAVYVYVAKVLMDDNIERTLSGSLTLMR